MNKTVEQRILKELPDKSLVVECGFCEGTGGFPSTATYDANEDNLGPCSVCGGKGIVLFKETIENLIVCKYCDGTGQGLDDGYFLGNTCEVCSGKGLTTIVEKNDSDEINICWTLIHPMVVSVAKSRIEAGHFADSVEAAFKEYNDVVKDIVKKATNTEFDGADLMRHAFSVNNPIVKLTENISETDKAIQQGYMEISAGAMTGIRNPKAHANIKINKNRALHMLFLCSLLFYNLEFASRGISVVSEDGD